MFHKIYVGDFFSNYYTIKFDLMGTILDSFVFMSNFYLLIILKSNLHFWTLFPMDIYFLYILKVFLTFKEYIIFTNKWSESYIYYELWCLYLRLKLKIKTQLFK